MIKITFGDNDTTARKLKILEKIKDSFYKHALNEVKNEYRTYNNISGPYFVYLVEKKDKEVKGILEKIIADTTMRHDNRESLKSFLKEYDTYYYINGKKRNIEIKDRIKKLPLKNIEKLDSEKQKQIDNLVHQIEELLKEQK